ncbi:MAG: hypothetical protein H7329_04735 [Opitutaceae bacterium]|nr:hypothetical protein [Cytophagales bacterium]
MQLRKIPFVQEFLRLNNESALGKLEVLLKKEKQKLYEKELNPFSVAELNVIIDKAEEDAKENRVKTASQLKKEIDSWI